MHWSVLAAILFVAVAAAEPEEYQLLRFGASWCEPCHALDKQMKTDKVKEALKKHKVKDVFIDIDKDTKGASNYKIEEVPTCILIRLDKKKEAHVLKRKSGSMSTEEILKLINPDEPEPEVTPKKD